MAYDNEDKLNKEKLKALRETHPYYSIFEDDWSFFESAYVGGSEFARHNIFKHERERQESYEDRVKRAFNWNFCAITTEYYTNFIFSDVIERNGGKSDTFYKEFIKNVNLKSDKIDTFMSNVSNDARIYGMVYILVEAPPKPEEVATKQQEEDFGIRPYWVLMHPDEVLDWNIDKFDNYTYLKRRQYSTEIDPVTSKRSEFEIYTEYFPDIIKITKVDVSEKKRPIIEPPIIVPNELGEIPIVCLKYKRHKKYPDMGVSFLIDIAEINRNVLNISSYITEFLAKQCFNVLVKQSSGFLNLQGQNDDLIGTNNTIEYPQGTNAPAYLTPPVEPGKYLQAERAENVNEIFRIAVQDIRSDLSNGEASSGFSQHQSFSRVVPFLSNWAEKLEETEHKLMMLTMKYKGKEPWNGLVKYKDHYEVTSITDAMTNLLMLFKDLALPSETFAKTQLKRLVAELDGKISNEDMLKVNEEIDKLDFKEWQDEVRMVTEKPVTSPSPTEQQKSKQTGTIAEVKKESVGQFVGSTNRLKR